MSTQKKNIKIKKKKAILKPSNIPSDKIHTKDENKSIKSVNDVKWVLKDKKDYIKESKYKELFRILDDKTIEFNKKIELLRKYKNLQDFRNIIRVRLEKNKYSLSTINKILSLI